VHPLVFDCVALLVLPLGEIALLLLLIFLHVGHLFDKLFRVLDLCVDFVLLLYLPHLVHVVLVQHHQFLLNDLLFLVYLSEVFLQELVDVKILVTGASGCFA